MRSFTPLKRRDKALATLPLSAAVSAAISATATLMPSVSMAQLEEVVVTARARRGITAGCPRHGNGLH